MSLLTLFFLALGLYPLRDAAVAGLPIFIFPLSIILTKEAVRWISKIYLSKTDKILMFVWLIFYVFAYLISAWSYSSLMVFSVGVYENKELLYLLIFPLLYTHFKAKDPQEIFCGFFLAGLLATSVGWYRFLSLEGGLISEHLLGYWGIRYDISTRNSDVLYPILGFFSYLNWEKKGLFRLPLLKEIPYFLFIIAIILSFSRGAWIACIFALILCAKGWWIKGTFRKIGSVVVVGALSATLLPMFFYGIGNQAEGLANRFLSIFDPSYDSSSSNTERGNLLGEVVRAFTEQPLGAGVGRMSDFLGERIQYASGNTGNAENAVLTLLGQYGLLPALLFASLYGFMLNSVIKCEKKYALYMTFAISLLTYLLFNHELNSIFCIAALAFAIYIQSLHGANAENGIFGTSRFSRHRC
jgi:O-antigen ligase